MIRSTALAIGYGGLAGAVAALVLWAMQQMTALVWSGEEVGWEIAIRVMAGGVLIAVLRFWDDGQPLAQQIESATHPETGKGNLRNASIMSAMAIIAVSFGGAIGPEAGILAVIAELAALVSLVLARNAAERHFLGEVGVAGAMGGLYGSPPGGAAMAQDDAEAPRWQIYLAGFAGLAGFLLVTRNMLHGEGMRVQLPPWDAVAIGSDMIWALLPAILGGAIGVFFVLLMPWLELRIVSLSTPVVQTLTGTAIFALLVSLMPVLRFSGHHELGELIAMSQEAGWHILLAIGVFKVVALCLCLASGWRGGAVFPLMFAGAAVGASTLYWLPQTPITVALVGAMTASITVGMGKPLAAMLVALLLLGPASVGAMAVGVMVGWLLSQRWPATAVH